ncbi:Glycosyl hydrolase family 57 [Phycisphaerae bacterium RAS1]|nr:Glycosyl hydrolase family 57 [Phycisphaerae bacterium RAS1]
MPHRAMFFSVATLAIAITAPAPEVIHVGFLWHMHQPIYYPYETVVQTNSAGRYSFSPVDVHNQRFGPYTGWPRDAVQIGLSLPHLGAQVSFSGSLIENLNALRDAGVNGGMWNNWQAGYLQAIGWNTALNNRRLDMVAFGYHHPLMPLLDEADMRMQIRLHKHIYQQTWPGLPYSRGIFPAETAFSTRMIPALVAEGVDWALVDNIHFDRACVGYPHTNSSCLFSPNRADQLNADPAAGGGAWVQLNNLWAPSRVSAPFGYQPHRIQHVNPATGAVTQMIAVPAARYEGNEDGRGGYGAFLYDVVMDAYLPYNTDAAHPMFVVLHHDGDNFGGGSEAYYHSNFQNMVNWAGNDPDYDVTTVEDYLDRFPPAAGDLIHVENGSWAGADCGDAEFKKWLGDPNAAGWSPDRNSWAVLTAAKNRVFMAEAIAPALNTGNIVSGIGTNTEKAWHWLLCGEASDYWYWDGSSEPWDSNVTRACNQAVTFADLVIAGQPDNTPPTVFVPQRDPYNPGGFEWAQTPEPSDFEVWTYAYDVAGLTSVTLKWRLDNDGANPLSSIQNETFAGGSEVGAWNSVAMTAAANPSVPANILPATYRATRYRAMITEQNEVLIDYYVEAVDAGGNITRTDIQHVYVGPPTGGGGGDVLTITPNPAVANQNVLIQYNPAGRPLAGAPQVYLHYGFNNWNPVISPDPAMTWNAGTSRWEKTVLVQAAATQLDMVFNNGAGTWDNNGGADWHFQVTGGQPQQDWQMDGALDTGAALVSQNQGMSLWAGIRGDLLYVATNDAGEGNDHFVFIAAAPGAMRAAPWAKAGQVADWSAFAADENNNDYEGWFDLSNGAAAQAATGANGGVLEGQINLRQELGGTLPSVAYLAVGAYATNDGGGLIRQVPPPVAANGSIEANEYIEFSLITELEGDANCDGSVDILDINAFVLALSDASAYAAAYPNCPIANSDVNDDGQVNVLDINPFVTLLAGP